MDGLRWHGSQGEVRSAGTQAIVIFVALGMASGLLGVALPTIEHHFAIPHHMTGALFTSMTAGFVLGSSGITWVVRRRGLSRSLILGLLLLTGSLIGASYAPSWFLLVAALTIHGIAAGAIGTGVNSYAVACFPPFIISWLHAGFGIGMAMSAALLSAMMGLGWSWHDGYRAIALLLIALVCWLSLARWLPDTTPPSNDRALPISSGTGLFYHQPVWLLGGMICLATIEGVVGIWAVSVLIGRGFAADSAGSSVALYWMAFTFGRLMIGGFVRFVAVRQIIRVSVWILLVGIVIFLYAHSFGGSRLGLMLIGVAVAPLFPLILAYTAEQLGPSRASHLTPVYSVTSNLSQTLLSSLAGIVASIWGTGAIALYLVVLSLGLVVLTEITVSPARQPYRLPGTSTETILSSHES